MGVVECLPGVGRDLFRLTGDILFFAGDIRNFVRESLPITSGIAIGSPRKALRATRQVTRASSVDS